ncbi:uncharacterized protein FIBRA_09380 [Fibroporia radiculosa]|uniref:Methylosome subunit pICln n=1 Tax=Fibroporia radiculosa TaxID=599839 RepID=J7SCZ8_9APHY|nr:uncharacterized protein FIBRA_09380 [Fibroporia radiculosa]CCM07058.1 predicted protein [Fibroporia radiculosa]
MFVLGSMAPFTLINALPPFISPDEHRAIIASTPSSFSDIPPVLRHREENVSVTIDPPFEGFTAQDAANGTLYVIESVLVFMSAAGRGFQVEYPSITLHAISRAESGPSIYCQLDEILKTVDGADPDGECEDDMKELIIVPRNSQSLESIFESLSICASLHPDPASMSDDVEDDAFIDADDLETFTGDENEELSEVGRAALAHLESIIYDPFDQSTGNSNADGG